jgi:hypothetical protein
MIVMRRILIGVLALTGFHAWAAEQPLAQLSPDMMGQAVQDDTFSVPTPGELLAALNKEAELAGAIPETDPDGVHEPAADCAEPGGADCGWVSGGGGGG